MNLFSKFCIYWLIFFSVPSIQAMNLMSIYTTACQRELGIILDVQDRKVSFLTIHGKIKTLSPYQIIFLAYYPVDQFPGEGKMNISSVDRIQVYTLNHFKEELLVEGWPIGFTKDKVSFLTVRGNETAISRVNIHSLKIIKNSSPFLFRKSAMTAKKFIFAHPYTFRKCSSVDYSRVEQKGNPVIYPQQVLSNTIMIKREIDDLAAGYKKIRRYVKEQKFYQTPERFTNKTSLGIWQSFGARYGASNKRPNNLTPLLIDEYSSDIFDYQHIFKTGSGPLFFAPHGEIQTQAYYAFKASYFNFSAFFDPSLFLVGKRYEWSNDDFKKPDDKIAPTAMLEMGFDWGGISTQFYLLDNWDSGVFDGSHFKTFNINVSRFGVSYANSNFDLELSAGSGSNSEDNIDAGAHIFRLNFKSRYFQPLHLIYSLIRRGMDLKTSTINYEGTSLENDLYINYPWGVRYVLSGYLGFENHTATYTEGSSKPTSHSSYLKAGGAFSLSF